MSLPASLLLQRLVDGGVLAKDAADRLSGQLDGRSAQELTDHLVGQGLATAFQCASLLEDEARTLVLGEYLLLDQLGEGGMGVVYKARHLRMERDVALKVLSGHLTDSDEARQRFYREVKAIARLQHPNIVMAFDASEAHGEHYLVMELVDGRDVDAIVRESGPLPLTLAINYTIQAAQGLGYAHSQGIVHRDVKPANLLATDAGQVKLLDLGIARLADPELGAEPTLTQTGLLLGTIAYMAPEHAENPKAANERCDVYSLGCTLYRMITGELPYSGTTAVQMLVAAREQAAPDMRSSLQAIGDGSWSHRLQAVFAKSVAKRPEQRHASMEELAQDLRQLLETAPAAAHTFRLGLPTLAEAPSLPPLSGAVAGASGATPLAAIHGSGQGISTGVGAGATSTSVTANTTLDDEAPTRIDAVPAAAAPARAPVARPTPSVGGGRTGSRPRPTTASPSSSSGLSPWLGLVLLVLLGTGAVVTWKLLTGGTEETPAVLTPSPVETTALDAVDAEPESTRREPQQRSTPPGPRPLRLDVPGRGLFVTEWLEKEVGTDSLITPLGGWQLADPDLATTTAPASLTVPFSPPGDYQVLLRFRSSVEADESLPADELRDPSDPLGTDVQAPVRLVLTTERGRALLLDLDRKARDGRRYSGFFTLDDPSPPPGARRGRVLKPGEQQVLEVQVRPDRVLVKLEEDVLHDGPLPQNALDRRTDGRLVLVSAGPLEVDYWEVSALYPAEVSPGGSPSSPSRPSRDDEDTDEDDWPPPPRAESSYGQRPPPPPPPRGTSSQPSRPRR
ncbi:MAG: serine/threonine-protein kinase [Acidobacteriota bacterium]